MKSLPPALAAHYALGTTTLAYALRIQRTDGAIFAFTSGEQDAYINGQNYTASVGLQISEIATSAGLAVDNLEMTTLDDGTVFTRLEILSGSWRNAAWTIFRYNYASVADGIDTMLTGTIGNVTLHRGQVACELRGLQQYLQQPIGNVSSKTCRARLGDDLCKVNLASYTVTGTVTSVTSNQVFTDTARAEAADYFAEGVLTFTSGGNFGLKQKVKANASGVLTMMLPFLATVQAGDTYSMYAGCRKRLAEDCIAKFGNVLNFQGEPHLPGIDRLTS